MEQTIRTESYFQFTEDFRSAIDRRPMSRLQIGVVIVCFVLNMLDGMDVLLVSYAAPVLAEQWSISPESLGVIFSAGLLGMAIGCLVIAPFADVIGRKPMILIALCDISLGMVLTALSTEVWHLIFWRFMTGLGIGAILASMATLVSEYSSDYRRNFNVGFLQAGYPIGATITGFVAAAYLRDYGWDVAFVIAGLLTGAMIPVVLLWLPESLEFLSKKQPKDALSRLNRIWQKMGNEHISKLPKKPSDVAGRVSVRDLFADDRTRPTYFLWGGIFFCFMTLYFAISWITKSAVDAGLPLDQAIYAGAIYNIGAFSGTLFLGVLSSRVGLQRTIFGAMCVASLFLLVFGWVVMPVAVIFLVTFLIGVSLGGGFNFFYPTATRLYPSHVRTTGVGWAVGVGRAGAVVGPLLAGYLMGAGVSIGWTFSVFAVPTLLGGICALMIKLPADMNTQ